jgi:hypothetical protein
MAGLMTGQENGVGMEPSTVFAGAESTSPLEEVQPTRVRCCLRERVGSILQSRGTKSVMKKMHAVAKEKGKGKGKEFECAPSVT